jgi:hypothetical protein
MCCILLELLKQGFLRRTYNIMDFSDLVKFIVSWEEGIQGNDFEQDAANAPQVHFVPVVTVSQ